jgi:hypothetical protein
MMGKDIKPVNESKVSEDDIADVGGVYSLRPHQPESSVRNRKASVAGGGSVLHDDETPGLRSEYDYKRRQASVLHPHVPIPSDIS